MLSSAEKLAKAGADFLICPDNTIHQAFDLVQSRSPRPWLHIAEEVANEAHRGHFKRLGVLGTRYLMEGPVYPEKLKAAGLDYRTPGPQAREQINQIIMDELVNAQFTAPSSGVFSGGDSVSGGRGLRRSGPGMHRNSIAGHAGILLVANAGFDSLAGQGRGKKSGRQMYNVIAGGVARRTNSAHAPKISTTLRRLRSLPLAIGCSHPSSSARPRLSPRSLEPLMNCQSSAPPIRLRKTQSVKGPWTCFKLRGPVPLFTNRSSGVIHRSPG